jgi:hypothetical protein
VGDGSPLAAVLIVGRGSRVDRHHRQVSLSVKRIHRGGDRDVVAAHGAARLVASAIPWTMSASGAEIGSLPYGFGDSWWSVCPDDEGAAPGGSRNEGR